MKIYLLICFVALLGTHAIDAFLQRSETEPDCSQYEDGETLPDTNSCSQYYLCVAGQAIKQRCAHGLYFDAMAGNCNRAFLVDCSLNRLASKLNEIENIIPNYEFYMHGYNEERPMPNAATSAPPCDEDLATRTTPTTTCSTTTTTTTPCATTKTTTTKTTTTKTTTTTCSTTTTTCSPTTTTTTCTTTTTTCSTTTTTCSPTTTTTTCTTTKTSTTKTTTTTCSTTTTTCTTTTTTCTTTTKTCTATTKTTATCSTTTPTCATTKSTKTTSTTTKCTTTICTTTKSTRTTCSTTSTCSSRTTPTCSTTTPKCSTTTSSCATSATNTFDKNVKLRYLETTKDCQSLPDGTIILDYSHCRRYYICTNQRAKRYRCRPGNWFDQDTLTCRPRISVTNCAAGRN